MALEKWRLHHCGLRGSRRAWLVLLGHPPSPHRGEVSTGSCFHCRPFMFPSSQCQLPGAHGWAIGTSLARAPDTFLGFGLATLPESWCHWSYGGHRAQPTTCRCKHDLFNVLQCGMCFHRLWKDRMKWREVRWGEVRWGEVRWGEVRRRASRVCLDHLPGSPCDAALSFITKACGVWWWCPRHPVNKMLLTRAGSGPFACRHPNV